MESTLNLLCKDVLIHDGWQEEMPPLQYNKALGSHLILDLFNCDHKTMGNSNIINEVFNRAAKEANCTIVAECYHDFEPFGVSGVTVISESHYTYHGWDEHGYAAIDLFYCGVHVDILKAIEVLVNHFKPDTVRILSMPRGIIT